MEYTPSVIDAASTGDGRQKSASTASATVEKPSHGGDSGVESCRSVSAPLAAPAAEGPVDDAADVIDSETRAVESKLRKRPLPAEKPAGGGAGVPALAGRQGCDIQLNPFAPSWTPPGEEQPSLSARRPKGEVPLKKSARRSCLTGTTWRSSSFAIVHRAGARASASRWATTGHHTHLGRVRRPTNPCPRSCAAPWRGVMLR